MFRYTLNHSKRAKKTILNKKEKNRKKEREKEPSFHSTKSYVQQHGSCFFAFFSIKKPKEKRAKSKEKEPKKSKRHLQKSLILRQILSISHFFNLSFGSVWRTEIALWSRDVFNNLYMVVQETGG